MMGNTPPSPQAVLSEAEPTRLYGGGCAEHSQATEVKVILLYSSRLRSEGTEPKGSEQEGVRFPSQRLQVVTLLILLVRTEGCCSCHLMHVGAQALVRLLLRDQTPLS